jgi:hypothetical protein
MKTIQTEAKDGDVIDVQPKSLGTTELYPNVLDVFIKIKILFLFKFKIFD